MYYDDHIPRSFPRGPPCSTLFFAQIMLVDPIVGIHSETNVCPTFKPRMCRYQAIASVKLLDFLHHVFKEGILAAFTSTHLEMTKKLKQ